MTSVEIIHGWRKQFQDLKEAVDRENVQLDFGADFIDCDEAMASYERFARCMSELGEHLITLYHCHKGAVEDFYKNAVVIKINADNGSQ